MNLIKSLTIFAFIVMSVMFNVNAQIGRTTGVYTLSNATIAKAISVAFNAHNLARVVHSVTNFTLDANLTASSQSWANYIASIATLKHFPDTYAFGENIFFSCRYMNMPNVSYTTLSATINYYNEIKYYNYSNPGYNGKIGHFSQMVWRDSKRMGVGLAMSNTTISGYPYQCIWAVMRYLPYGNIAYASAYRRNVLPPKGYPDWSKA